MGRDSQVKEVERICVCTRSALMTWCRAYRKDGLVALFDKRKGGNHAKLKADQVELIRTLLHTYTPAQLWSAEVCAGEGDFWTVPDLAHLVEERCHVVYQSDNSYRLIFGKCDFTPLRLHGTPRACNGVGGGIVVFLGIAGALFNRNAATDEATVPASPRMAQIAVATATDDAVGQATGVALPAETTMTAVEPHKSMLVVATGDCEIWHALLRIKAIIFAQQTQPSDL